MTGETNSRVVFDSRKNDGRYDAEPSAPIPGAIAKGDWGALIDRADDVQAASSKGAWNDTADYIASVRAKAVVPILCEWFGENGDDRAADLLGEGYWG